MIDSTQMLDALCDACRIGLMWRRDDFQKRVSALISTNASAGRLNSSATLFGLSEIFQGEAKECADWIGEEIRRSRASWSFAAIVHAEMGLSQRLPEVVEQHLRAMVHLVEQHAPGLAGC